MAATAESMLSSLAGPAEGSEGSAPSAPAPSETPAEPAAPSSDPAPAASEPQPAAAAAAPAAPKDSPEDVQRKLGAALHETRTENKTLKQTVAQLTSRLEALEKAGQPKDPQQPQEPPEPDFLADPKGYVDQKVQAALAKLDKAEKTTQETAEQVKQREANEAVLRATQSAEAQFYSQTPDYPEALQHIRGVRTQQLQELFPEATTEQINNHIAYEERETAKMLVSQNRNPAEFAYKMAKTLGYVTKAPPPAPKPAAAPIDKDAVRTLGSGGGNGAPTEDAGNNMPEFAAARAEVAARFKRKK
jgi:hypothetical protein